MKAILKNNRKVIVDVEPIGSQFCKNWFNSFYYVDKNKCLYRNEQLDFIEYYGG